MRALMGNLTIRNMDDAVIDRLEAWARANERSLGDEVRYLLGEDGRRSTPAEDSMV